MSVWPKEELHEGIDLVSGQHITADDCNESGLGTAYLTGPSDFYEQEIRCSRFTERPRVMCKKGDILVTVKGSGTGSVVIADREYCIGRQLMAVRPTSWNRDFLFQCFKQMSRTFTARAAGLIPGIGRDDILGLPLPKPPLPEQERITSILGAWDKRIASLTALLRLNIERKRALMQRLLTGKARFKVFKGESWRSTSIGSLLEECDRYIEWSNDQAYRFASIRRRSGGLFDRGTFFGHEIKTKVLKSLKTGDFVISKRQVVHGAWAMVTKPFDGFGVSDEYDVLANRDPKALDMRFFNYLSQTRRLWHMAYLASNGVHIEKLIFDFDDFAKEKVKIPPTVEEQAMIVDVLSACDREIELLEKQLEALKQQKRGLMQKLLTGEVRVKVLKEGK